jgi:hypothetical protein
MVMLKLHDTTWHFAEERKPCGEINRLKHMSFYEPIHGSSDLSRCLVSQPMTHPWFIIIWEPLDTKAPSPSLTQVWCCYSNTVVFYQRGYILRQFSTPCPGRPWKFESPGKRFQEWDQTRTRLRHDDIVDYKGTLFEVGGGRVVWANKRWWMRHSARSDSKRLSS